MTITTVLHSRAAPSLEYLPLVATVCKASSGHALNQSIVQQLINDGNCKHLNLNESPTGDKHKTICKLSLTRLTNNLLHKSRFASRQPKSLQTLDIPTIILSHSSDSNKFGTLPLFNNEETSSKKPSLMICVSVKLKPMLSPFTPALIIISFNASLNSKMPNVAVLS